LWINNDKIAFNFKGSVGIYRNFCGRHGIMLNFRQVTDVLKTTPPFSEILYRK
jgi:hypothetical protein